jgi:regulator of sigma E protease
MILSYILGLVAFLIILGLLVTIHELGHFLAAKWAKMRVEEFSIGFPPRIYNRQAGETKYVLGLLPLGGYVRIAGEQDEPEKGVTPEPGTFLSASVPKRMVVILAGVFMNFMLGWLILVVAFSVGFTSLTQDLTTVPGAQLVREEVLIVSVRGESPADTAGIQAGDILRSFEVNDEEVTVRTPAELLTMATGWQESGVSAVTAKVTRQGEEVLLPITIAPTGLALGVGIQSIDTVRVPVWQAPVVAARESWGIMRLTGEALARFGDRLFTRGELDESVSGPIGVYQATTTATKIGFSQLVLLTVVLSLNLGVLNLLPIPALDGGRFLFLVAEALTGGRPQWLVLAERWLVQLSFAAVLLLMALITVRDIFHLF